MPYLTKDDAIRTLIKYLEKSNIFSSYLSIQQIEIKLNEIVEKVEIEVLSSEGLSGYWETQDKKLGLDNKLFNPLFYTSANRDEVIIHELLHALTTKYINGKTFCGLKYYEKRDGYEEHGRGFNEGTTEYLAQLICPTDKPTVFEYNEKIKFKNVGTYKMEQIAIKQLAILYGQDKIIKAYLQNEDIEMPELQYKNLRDNFDFINEKNSFIRNILAEREYKDLTDEWKAKIDDAKNNISDTFITSQQYFLEQCLSQEIDNMETKEQAEELREKLKQLNDLGIEIKGNEKANYEKYNHKFIRKYLEIVNKDRSPQELVGFDAVEEYITSNQKILLQNESFFSKMKISFNILKEKIMSRSEKEENRFIPIERGNEETIYIRECGKESVGGIYIKQYHFCR